MQAKETFIKRGTSLKDPITRDSDSKYRETLWLHAQNFSEIISECRSHGHCMINNLSINNTILALS